VNFRVKGETPTFEHLRVSHVIGNGTIRIACLLRVYTSNHQDELLHCTVQHPLCRLVTRCTEPLKSDAQVRTFDLIRDIVQVIFQARVCGYLRCVSILLLFVYRDMKLPTNVPE
jgi:hypothetical protein